MQKKTIAQDKAEILDLYDRLDFPSTFAILAHLSKDAMSVQYDNDEDVFIAQYADRSYIIGRNVLGRMATTNFEIGILTDLGWKKLQNLMATQEMSAQAELN